MNYNDINELKKSINNELQMVLKTNIKDVYEESQVIVKNIIRNCELELDRLNKGIIIEMIRGDM